MKLILNMHGPMIIYYSKVSSKLLYSLFLLHQTMVSKTLYDKLSDLVDYYADMRSGMLL